MKSTELTGIPIHLHIIYIIIPITETRPLGYYFRSMDVNRVGVKLAVAVVVVADGDSIASRDEPCDFHLP